MRNAKLFAGTSHLSLAERVAAQLGAELAPVNLRRYTNRETTVDLGCSVREKDVYILQSGSMTTNDHLMEALIMVSAARLASARKITVVMPYFPYSKQSKKKKRRGAISGKLVASMLTVSGADHVITMDLHASQMAGFFSVPVDNLLSEPTIARWLAENVIRAGEKGQAAGAEGVVVVAKNAGGAKRVTALADRLGTSFALIHTDNAPTTRPYSRTPSSVALHTLPPTLRGHGMFADVVSGIPITSPRAQSPLRDPPSRGSQTDMDVQTIAETHVGRPAAARGRARSKSKPDAKKRNAGISAHQSPELAADARRATFYVSPVMPAEEHPPEPEELDISQTHSPPGPVEISEVLNRSDDDDDDDIDDSRLMEMVNTPLEDKPSHAATPASYAAAAAAATVTAAVSTVAISSSSEASVHGAALPPSLLTQEQRALAVPASRRSTFTSSMQRITSGTHLQSDPPLQPPVAVTSWRKKRNARITLIGDVRGKLVLLLDDMIDHPSSFLTAAEHLMVQCGARAVYIVASHGLFSGSSMGEIEVCPYVHRVIVTNSFPIPDELTSASSKLVQIDVAPVLAEAIRRNHNGESISYLFDRNPF